MRTNALAWRLMNSWIALTRHVSPAIAACELTHLDRVDLDWQVARAQHQAYVNLLQKLGCEVHQLPAEENLPDCVFIEDTALVLPEVAVMTRPGAASRQPEVPAVEATLADFRPICRIDSPGALDGGDVLRVGRDLYVGRSTRTNSNATEQLQKKLDPFGYRVHPVEFRGCLHLKSAVTQVDTNVLLYNPDWMDPFETEELEWWAVDSHEPFAANAVFFGDKILYAEDFPRTRDFLSDCGVEVHTVDVSELAKAEGAVTCCSLLFKARA